MRKLFIFCVGFLFTSVSLSAEIIEHVQIDNLYYNLNTDKQTAEVTFHQSWSDMNYYGLSTVTIPESVMYDETKYWVNAIGTRAFQYCFGLNSVTFSDLITIIGVQAFEGCSSLTSISLPNSVKEINDGAFMDCVQLTSIVIPSAVLSIGALAFSNCFLTSITVDSSNPNYCSLDGVLFDKDMSLLIQYPIGKTDESYAIPNSVTRIADDAFLNCFYLTEINIPTSVIVIGDGAFEECIGLASITIPSGVKDVGGYTFAFCSGLTSITCEAIYPPTLGQGNVFYFMNTDTTIPLYVPLESVNEYKEAHGWKDFGDNIIPIQETAINENINPSDSNFFKTMRGGQILILHNGKTYTITGAETE